MNQETNEHRWIGKPTPTLEAPGKARGTADFVTDLRPSRMLIGKVLRSPHPYARLASLDTTAAKKVSGVRAVLTWKDIPQVRWGHEIKDQTALAADYVRFAGEEVAAVAAVDEDAAFEALERIRVEYEPLSPVLNIDAALAEGAPRLHEHSPDNVARRMEFLRGDPDREFNQAAAIYENVFETSMQHHAYMEPIGTVAEVDSSGKVTLYAPVQNIFPARDRVAEALGVSASWVRVVQPTVGGAFGGKMVDEPNTILAALLARAARMPVQLMNTRTEEFRASRPRVPYRIRLRVGVASDGTLVAKEALIWGDAGAYCGRTLKVLSVTCMRMDNCYQFKSLKTDARMIYTNRLPAGAFRGMGNPQMVFALEACLDHLAEELGIDPLELRLKNAIREGETSIHGWEMKSCGLTDCIEKAAEACDWLGHRKEKSEREGDSSVSSSGTPGKVRGLGMACAVHVSGNRVHMDWDGANAEIRIREDGRASLVIGEGDIGQGANTVLALIAAEELGFSLEDVELSPADTDSTPLGFGARASRLTFIAGNAVREAAKKAKNKILHLAAIQLEAPRDDLQIDNGWISVVGSKEKGISVHDLVKGSVCRPGWEPIVTQATYDPPSVMADKTRYGNVAGAYTFTAQVAEVEVDCETGRVEVLRLIAADDIGRALNPLTAEGQVEGAVIQGLGLALSEGMIFDGGEVVNGNFADYPLPKAEGSPLVETYLVETNDPYGPFGGKGGSETPIDPTAAAIANAVYDATGVRMTSLPITAEKLLKALKG
jgi:CO/xanthine dehydrogenase Mo-binding subunit